MKKTLYVQPAVHNNQYTEFQIPRNQLQNFRLIDLGVQNYVANGGGNPRKYNFISGAVSIIDTVSLYNDTELINQCRNCDKVMEFSSLSEGAMMNYSKTQGLIKNQTNLDADDVIEIQTDNLTTALGAKNPTYLDLWRLLPFLMGLDIDKFDDLKESIKNKNRKKVKQILKTSNVIYADKLNLRLVIEYSTKSPSNLFENGNDGDTYNIIKPVLVCDQVMDVSSNSFQVVYDNWDNEIITLTQEMLGTDKKEDRILYGTIGRYVSDVWILNAPASSTGTGSGSYGLYDEMVNLVVNEVQIVPNNQCNTPARKQMFLNYTSPNFMTPLISNVYGHGGTENNELYGANTTPAYTYVGLMSYVNLSVEKVVESMRLYLDFKAWGTKDVTLGGLNVNLFYRCKRTLSYNNGQTLVSN